MFIPTGNVERILDREIRGLFTYPEGMVETKYKDNLRSHKEGAIGSVID